MGNLEGKETASEHILMSYLIVVTLGIEMEKDSPKNVMALESNEAYPV
jgi:hypothetical protein